MFESSGTVAEEIGGGTHTVEHGQEEVVHGGIVGVREVTPGFDGAVSASREYEWEIVVGVAVTVAESAAAENHGAIEE